jgi:predicted nucleic acid-binding protein
MALVVDTSVWVDYFNGAITPQTDALDDWLGMEEIIIGDLILTEVLQGFRHDRDYRQALRLLQAFPIVTMLGPELAVRSAQHYRTLRSRGVTVRKTIDVIIGTYCIVQGVPLLHSDRDFAPLVYHLGLRVLL